MFNERINLFDVFLGLLIIVLTISFINGILNYDYNIYEYCYHYVTLDNEEVDYCSKEEVCNFSNRMQPETGCKIDGKYFLVKELELDKKVLRTTTPLKELKRKNNLESE